MNVRVWVDQWQQQCCGGEFRVGSDVRWTVGERSRGPDDLARLFGPRWSDDVRFAEDHHVGRKDGSLSGRVRHIKVVTCDRVRESADSPLRVPVPGSARLRAVDVADRWEPEPADRFSGWTFEGWIVDLESAIWEPDVVPG